MRPLTLIVLAFVVASPLAADQASYRAKLAERRARHCYRAALEHEQRVRNLAVRGSRRHQDRLRQLAQQSVDAQYPVSSCQPSRYQGYTVQSCHASRQALLAAQRAYRRYQPRQDQQAESQRPVSIIMSSR